MVILREKNALTVGLKRETLLVSCPSGAEAKCQQIRL